MCLVIDGAKFREARHENESHSERSVFSVHLYRQFQSEPYETQPSEYRTRSARQSLIHDERCLYSSMGFEASAVKQTLILCLVQSV